MFTAISPWRPVGNVCVYNNKNKPVVVGLLSQHGDMYRIGDRVFRFGHWRHGETRRIAPDYTAMRVSHMELCPVDSNVMGSADF